jgi:hypothetical protein
MITVEKIKIFLKYRGDLDAWARLSKKREAQIMTDSDWKLIDDCIQGIYLVKSGKASTDFEVKHKRKIEANISDDDALKMINQLAREEINSDIGL